MKSRKAQAAFEYLTTYGWAILSAIVAIGALSYFGLLSPANLLPSKCDFGKQLECLEYKIISDGHVYLNLRNNFGKDISIMDVEGVNDIVTNFTDKPNPDGFRLFASGKRELVVTLNKAPPAGDKKEVALILTFKRVGNYPQHNLTGAVFATVQRP